MNLLLTLVLAAGLIPVRGWTPQNTPITVAIEHDQPTHLVMMDFDGKTIEPLNDIEIPAGRSEVDLKGVYPQLNQPGTYLVHIKPVGDVGDFIGTPIVVGVRADRRSGASQDPMIVRVEPLRYATVETTQGTLTLAFYYDAAPNTVRNFLDLAADGFYDGLTFHRVVPGFVLQGGDPRGDGTGGPGYRLTGEFNDRTHRRGTVSMSRLSDPDEGPGVRPRAEFADSAGSQFFICLDTEATSQLDGRYAAFAEVTDGMDAVDRLAATPLEADATGKPVEEIRIVRVSVLPVTNDANPYPSLFLNPTERGDAQKPPVDEEQVKVKEEKLKPLFNVPGQEQPTPPTETGN